MFNRHFPLYGLRYRIGSWRYRRRHPWQFPADPPVEDRPGARASATLRPPIAASDRVQLDEPPARTVEVDSVRDQTYWVMEYRGDWVVRHDDIEIATLPNRTTALTVAVLRAHEDRPSEVVILGRDGAIEEKCDFA